MFTRPDLLPWSPALTFSTPVCCPPTHKDEGLRQVATHTHTTTAMTAEHNRKWQLDVSISVWWQITADGLRCARCWCYCICALMCVCVEEDGGVGSKIINNSLCGTFNVQQIPRGNAVVVSYSCGQISRVSVKGDATFLGRSKGCGVSFTIDTLWVVI